MSFLAKSKPADKPTIMDQVCRARWLAVQKERFPYLGKMLWALTFVESDVVPTMGVDDRLRVYINPTHVAECLAEGIDVLIAGIVHEGLHPFLRHSQRAKAISVADHAHWNQCGDAELVQHIQEARIKIWSKDITPERMGWPVKLTAEEYYRLPRNSGKSGKKGEPGPCSGGSGATGQAQPWELPAPGEHGFEDGKTPSGMTHAEVTLVVAATAQDIKKQAENNYGSVPAGILRWAEDILEPEPIPWDVLLASRVRYYTESRRGPVASYARPSRRQAGGLILPVHHMPARDVIVVGDTSGSMGDDDIAKILGTVYQAIEALGSVKALGCDAAATEPVEVRHIEDLRAALAGGGGTDMSVGIAKADEGAPDAIVVVTDGETPWPKEKPETPVVIVLTRARGRYCGPPPVWADVIDASEVRG